MKRIMVSNFGYKRDQASGFPWVLLKLLIMVMAGQKVMTRTWKSYSKYQKIWLWCGRVQKFERKNHKCCPLKIAKLKVELLDPWNDPHLIRCTSRILPSASYFHKGLMWRGVKVEKSRKNGFSYDKAIFWQNL